MKTQLPKAESLSLLVFAVGLGILFFLFTIAPVIIANMTDLNQVGKPTPQYEVREYSLFYVGGYLIL